MALLLGFEGVDCEDMTLDPASLPHRYERIVATDSLNLGSKKRITYNMDKDMMWRMDSLPQHPNGMRFAVFDKDGTLLATNTYFSVGGGFVVNEKTQVCTPSRLYSHAFHA